MGITNSRFYMSSVFIVAILSLLVFQIGTVSINSPIVTLDNKSIQYVESYSVQYTQTGFGELADQKIGVSAATPILLGTNNTGEIIATDNFAIPKSTEGSTAGLKNKFKLMYTVPNLFTVGVGLKPLDFEDYVNVFGSILALGMLLLFIKLIFNAGNS